MKTYDKTFWFLLGVWTGMLLMTAFPAKGAEYRRVDTSAYCICKACCGHHARGITASGKPAYLENIRKELKL